MEHYYLILVVLLFIFAISDLIVGVSNDAVNFLNSAIGSKVARRKTIMIIASLGVLVGASFSSGMMEIARKGIFNPELFYFSEIMALFIAVMLTDIILLDLFNTLGLPTSTTVSIVFELLGAAVVISLFKIWETGADFGSLGDYINGSSAILIISGIFLSIIFAFTIGAIVQYLSRLLFTFHIEKRLQSVGIIWSGLALTGLSFFLLIKGIKGASFATESLLEWVNSNTILLVLILFFSFSILMWVLHRFRINILRIVVLFGTFALAMAFAGNDLVNFIGVPIAGLESFIAWTASGVDPERYRMDILREAFQTKSYLLILAGLIMAITLWVSKKARSVTETEVNLGSHFVESERFSSNYISQAIVRRSRSLGNAVQYLIPGAWRSGIEERFKENGKISSSVDPKEHPPAFDLVRASVNLAVASMLIALATSYKMPMSTTYVSFMVAMGTSLADRAWGRDSAVYRVSGVLSVIGGWFLTALIASLVAGLFALIILKFQIWAILTLVVLVIFLIIRSNIYHSEKEAKKIDQTGIAITSEKLNSDKIIEDTAERISNLINRVPDLLERIISALNEEDRIVLREVKAEIAELKRINDQFNIKTFISIKKMDEEAHEASRAYLLVMDMEQDLLQSISYIARLCRKYVKDSLPELHSNQVADLNEIMKKMDHFINEVSTIINDKKYQDFPEVKKHKKVLFEFVENLMIRQINGIRTASYGSKNSSLYFDLLLEFKDVIAVCYKFAKLYKSLADPMDKRTILINEISIE